MKPWLILIAVALAPPAAGAGRESSIQAAIVGGASASVVLQRWCADHGLPRLTARRVKGAAKTPDPSVLAALAARPGERLGYRRVTLACGREIMSRADNWYLPGHLTPEMNHQLDATDQPFGLVVQALGFHRSTLRASSASGPFEVRAVLATRDGTPFSYVVETYAPVLTVDRQRPSAAARISR